MPALLREVEPGLWDPALAYQPPQHGQLPCRVARIHRPQRRDTDHKAIRFSRGILHCSPELRDPRQLRRHDMRRTPAMNVANERRRRVVERRIDRLEPAQARHLRGRYGMGPTGR
jgi:hypothetical protein